jgi:DNA-binding GntR family transcriptional regulator
MSKYEDVVTQLRSMIQGGQLAPGAQLPSIAQLKEQFGVSYGTIRSAMLVLKAENRIVGAQGVGVFVASRQTDRSQ